jgi:hypothetical protein
LAVTDSALTSQEAGNSNIDGVENNPVTDFVDGDEGSNPCIDGMCDNWHNNAGAQVGAPSFSYTNDLKWTVALLKIVDDIKATNGAFGKILLWAREAASAQYSFYPHWKCCTELRGTHGEKNSSYPLGARTGFWVHLLILALHSAE